MRECVTGYAYDENKPKTGKPILKTSSDLGYGLCKDAEVSEDNVLSGCKYENPLSVCDGPYFEVKSGALSFVQMYQLPIIYSFCSCSPIFL